MSPTSILWYNDCLMKVTTDFLNVCRVGSDGRSGIPNVEQPQLFKRDDISLKNPSMHSNESVNPANYCKLRSGRITAGAWYNNSYE